MISIIYDNFDKLNSWVHFVVSHYVEELDHLTFQMGNTATSGKTAFSHGREDLFLVIEESLSLKLLLGF